MPTKPRFISGFPPKPRSLLRNRQGIPRLSGVSSRAHEGETRGVGTAIDMNSSIVECHSEATRGRSPVSPDRPTKIVLRRSVASAQYAASQYRDILQAAAITQSM